MPGTESYTLYHNPRCSKSRAALRLLRAHGIEPRLLCYLENPPKPARLRALLEKLGLGPRDLLRKREAPYKEQGLDRPDLPDAAILQAMSEYPILIERPILVRGSRAVLGRPPEQVLQLLPPLDPHAESRTGSQTRTP